MQEDSERPDVSCEERLSVAGLDLVSVVFSVEKNGGEMRAIIVCAGVNGWVEKEPVQGEAITIF